MKVDLFLVLFISSAFALSLTSAGGPKTVTGDDSTVVNTEDEASTKTSDSEEDICGPGEASSSCKEENNSDVNNRYVDLTVNTEDEVSTRILDCGPGEASSSCKEEINSDAIIGRIGSQWKAYAYSLMCNHGGSRWKKTKKVRDVLADDYPDNNWFVNINDDVDKNWSATKGTGTHESWENSCGYDMYIWTRPDSYFTKTSCSTSEKNRVKSIIRCVQAKKSSAKSIRDQIKYEMGLFGIDYHFIWVDGQRGTSMSHGYKSCYVRIDNGYSDVSVFIA